MNKISHKLLLYTKCMEYVDQRIANIQTTIDAALESGNDETKGSAGDKHETGRAMAQLEQEKASKQLQEANKLKEDFLKIDPYKSSTLISKGSVVLTDKGNFYISIAAGKMEIENEIYFVISPASPIAVELMGAKEKEERVFNGQRYCIKTIL